MIIVCFSGGMARVLVVGCIDDDCCSLRFLVKQVRVVVVAQRDTDNTMA